MWFVLSSLNLQLLCSLWGESEVWVQPKGTKGGKRRPQQSATLCVDASCSGSHSRVSWSTFKWPWRENCFSPCLQLSISTTGETCPHFVPQGWLWRLMNWYLWSASRSVAERPYEVKSVRMIIKLLCLRSDSPGLGDPEREVCSLSSSPLLEQRRPQPVLVKIGLSLCGWMSSGLHILSPLSLAPWLGPDLGSSPAPLIRMPNSTPCSWGELWVAVFLKAQGSCCVREQESHLTLRVFLRKKGQSFLCQRGIQTQEDLCPGWTGGLYSTPPAICYAPFSFLFFFFPFPSNQPSSRNICFTNISSIPLSFPSPCWQLYRHLITIQTPVTFGCHCGCYHTD